MLAETEEAVVAPARSPSRWNAGRGTFSPLRGSAIEPVMTTVLPARGAPQATTGGRSSSRTSRATLEFAEAVDLGAQAREVPGERSRDLRADVVDLRQRLLAGARDLLQRGKPARHRRAAVPSEAIGIARPISARRRPTAAPGDDRLNHPVGTHLADAVELQQPLPGSA